MTEATTLAFWAGRLGVPVPAPVALHETDEQDCLVSGYIDDDGSEPDAAAFGPLLRLLHEAPPPDLVPAALLLAIVFRIGDPDPDRAARATARVRELLATLPTGDRPTQLSG